MTRDEPRHPMGVVVQRTGLSSHVLRAWERRYGAVSPGRTEGGQRLYSDADVLRLRLLRRATEGGRAIGSVAALATEELTRLVGEDRAADLGASGKVSGVESMVSGGGPGARTSAAGHLERALAAAERLDAVALRTELTTAVVGLGAPAFARGVVVPLLERVGDRWEAGTLRPSQEHVVSTAVRHVLDWVLVRYAPPSSAPALVAGTLPGELHEFGAMLAAAEAAHAGWRVLYLGPSLPPEEIALAAERWRAQVVAVSVVYGGGEGAGAGSGTAREGRQGDGERVRRALTELRDALPAGALLVVGGRRSPGVAPAGVTRAADLDELGVVLEAASSPEGNHA